ncbi:MAG: HEAT repeat domain-containing protein [Myxococcales bacterium]|nr:HEAT repeat domain-containing protein [Myxococcales bacterium]
MKLRSSLRASVALTALATTVLLSLAPLTAFADRAKAMLYVVQDVDLGGAPVQLIVPLAEPGLADSSVTLRPSRAFSALKARSSEAYGNSSLRIDSASKATLVIGNGANADLVVAEVFWTLASMGVTDLSAPPFIQGNVKLDQLTYGAHALMLSPFDLLSFARRDQIPQQAWVILDGVPVPARDAARGMATGAKKLHGPKLRGLLSAAVSAKSKRAKMAVINGVAKPAVRKAYNLKIDLLVPALSDRSLAVRSAALDACISAGAKRNAAVLSGLEKIVENDSDTDLKLRAVKALSKAGVSKYNDLLQAEKLRSGTPAEALSAVRTLAKSKQAKIAAPALVSALTHRDESVRNAAFKGLVAMAQFELLHKALPSGDLAADMKEQIAKTLVAKGGDVARDESLNYLITKGSADGAIFAAQTYGKRGSKAATPLLIAALKHQSPMVRQTAAEALGLIKDERAIVPLADAAQARRRDEEYMMRAAESILKTLSLSQVKRLVKSRNLTIRQMAIRSLAGFAQGSRPNPSVVALLMDALKDPDPTIKRAAVYALADIRDDGIARDLSKLTKDPDTGIRVRVAYALGRATERFAEAGKLLMEMMRDREKTVRVAAIDGIALRKESGAFGPLMRLVNYPDPKIKRAVFAALLALRTPANAQALRMKFRKGMETRDSAVRLVCIQALSDRTVAADIDALRQASFDKSKEVKLSAIAVLAKSKLPEALEVLALWFADANMKVREAALDGLASVPAPGSWAAKKKRYVKDFIGTPGQPKALIAKAKKIK